MHIIAAKAVAFGEALRPEFKDYQEQVLKNAKAMSERFMERGVRLISGGTDTHLMLIDVTSLGTNGQAAEDLLGEANITCNKNSIPNDKLGVRTTSGIRLGTPAITTRGMNEEESVLIADLIIDLLKGEKEVKEVKETVLDLCQKHPLYK